jgi:hypothetical protein
MPQRIHFLALTIFLSAALSAGAQQYQAVVLAQNGDAQSAYGGRQYGSVHNNTRSHAAMWTGTPESLTDLAPGNVTSSFFQGTDGVNAVGVLNVSGMSQAGLYLASSNSWVSLHPSNYQLSIATAVSGSAQVGYIFYTTTTQINHAAVWHGTPESVVDLTPGNAFQGEALGVYNEVEVGYRTTVDSWHHACIWTGTAESRVDIHPAGAENSHANGIFGTEQVGYFDFDGKQHACLWHGTAASCVDLSPLGYSSSVAAGTDGTTEVGYGYPITVGQTHALVWSGSAQGAIDLHPLLPSEYYASGAEGIDPVTGAVVGYGFAADRVDAVVWLPIRPFTGHVNLGDYGGPVAGQSVTIEVRNPGTPTVVKSYATTLDASGNFAVTTTLFGNYDVAVKASHWLRKLAHVTFDRSGASSVSVTLANGDVNGDNVVSLGDFTQLRAAFGSSPGAQNWNPNADLNGDDSVSLGDFTILRAHFGASGD